jgi:hypothetical protein
MGYWLLAIGYWLLANQRLTVLVGGASRKNGASESLVKHVFWVRNKVANCQSLVVSRQ